MSDYLFKVRVLWVFLRDAFEGWQEQVGKRELDLPYCCDGRECCCGAMTVREAYSISLKDHPNG